MDRKEAKQINTNALAWIGDAVYEVAIRDYIIKTGQHNADRLHQIAVHYVRAEGQAAAIKKLITELTEEEQALVKRARNRKITSMPRNVEPITYKWATALEAFVGYLHLTEQQERLDWFIDRAISIINYGE